MTLSELIERVDRILRKQAERILFDFPASGPLSAQERDDAR